MQPAQADILATDSFSLGTAPEIGEYSTGKLLGQNAACVPGWSGKHEWRGSSVQFRAVDKGFVRAVIPYARGGKVQYLQTKDPGFRHVSRRLDVVPPSESYFISCLLNPGGGQVQKSAGNAHALVGFAPDIDKERFEGLTRTRGILIGFCWQPTTGSTDLVVRCSTTRGTTQDFVLLQNVTAQTYLVVVKMLLNSDADGTDLISCWVNPTSLTDEDSASATSMADKVISVNCAESPADLNKFVALTNDWSGTFYFDEVRLCTRIEDISSDDRRALLPALAALSLIGLTVGGGYLLMRRAGVGGATSLL